MAKTLILLLLLVCSRDDESVTTSLHRRRRLRFDLRGRHEIGASERRKSREVERENHSVSKRRRP
uniref:Secreted protein n=1 Tax=Oryza meridionalis TaxID=40149 RepID=A0A0E0C648_9ORYZ